MVGPWLNALHLLAQQDAQPKTLPEPVRQIALMAILGIALLGMLLIVGILLGGHWVRRWGERVRRTGVPPDMMLRRQPPPVEPQLPTDRLNDGDTFGPEDTTVS